MRYLIQEVSFSLAQRGVVAEAVVSLPTRTQCANATAVFKSGGRNFLAAAFNLWRAIRRGAWHELANDGEWSGSTSDFRRGLFGSSAR